MLRSGMVLGGLRIDALIGRGAMGEVYRGEQLALHRTVAIKRIAPHLAQERELIARFEREARCVARLADPHVVAIHDFTWVREPGGAEHALLVMEWVEGGRHLKQFVSAGHPLPWPEACAVVRHVARGLAAAHLAGIVHRDIKPANILISAGGLAKLADFGLATAGDLTTMTMDGAIVGTPAYLSPEACQGRPVGPAGDLYSLGATWFHLLTGRPPYEAGSTVAMLRAHCDDPIPDVTEVVTGLPPAAAALLRRCLAKDPAQRPADAGELLREFAALPDLPETLDHLVHRQPINESSTIATAPADQATRLAATPVTAPLDAATATLPAAAPATAATRNTGSSATLLAPIPLRRRPWPVALGLLVLAGLGAALLLRDPLAASTATVEAALERGDLALALTSAAAAVARHPDRPEGHALLRRVVDAEVDSLLVEAHFAEALALIAIRKGAHDWLRIEPWDQRIRLAEADFHLQRGARNAAEDLHLALHASYPVDLALRRRYLEEFGRSGERVASRASDGAALAVARGSSGELDAIVGDTLLDHLARHGTYDRVADPLREILLAQYRAPTVAAARRLLGDAEDGKRIGAFRTLRAAAALDPVEELRFHVHFMLRSSFSEQLTESLAWVEQAASRDDWEERKRAAGLGELAEIPIFDRWSDEQRRVAEVIAAHLLAEATPMLLRLVVDPEQERGRWTAWGLLTGAGIDPGIDPDAFHGATLTSFDPTWTHDAYTAARDHYAALVAGPRATAAQAVLADAVERLDRIIRNCEDQPRFEQVAENARVLRAELAALGESR